MGLCSEGAIHLRFKGLFIIQELITVIIATCNEDTGKSLLFSVQTQEFELIRRKIGIANFEKIDSDNSETF